MRKIKILLILHFPLTRKISFYERWQATKELHYIFWWDIIILTRSRNLGWVCLLISSLSSLFSVVLNLSLAVAAEDKSQTVDARVVKLTFLCLWGSAGQQGNNGLCSLLLLPRSIVYQTTQSVYSTTYHLQYWEQSYPPPGHQL